MRKSWTASLSIGAAMVVLSTCTGVALGERQGADGLIGHWLFEPDHVSGQIVKDRAGTCDATIKGPARFKTDLPFKPLLVDDAMASITLPYDLKKPGQPTKAMTVEAWLCIEKTVEWANIISATAGDKGWSLGYRQSSFSFGVSGKGTKGLTHLRTRHSLEWGRWYHVVGTYDGKAMRVYVDGELENESDAQKGDIDLAPKAPYVIGSFGKYCPRALLHEIRVFDRALDADQIAAAHRAKRSLMPELFHAKVGPILDRLDRKTIRITWTTAKPVPTVLRFGPELPLSGSTTRSHIDTKPKTEHAVTIDAIAPKQMYYYRIANGPAGKPHATSRLFEFDSTFDYTPPQVSFATSPFPENALTKAYADAADRIVRKTGIAKGWCVVLGCEQGRLAWELVKRTQLKVLCVDDDRAKVRAIRETMDKAGVYGVRISAQQASLDRLPLASYLANLIVSESLMERGELPGSASEIFRVLRPCGGIAWLGWPGALKNRGSAVDRAKLEGWLASGGMTSAEWSTDGGMWALVRRGPLADVGDWTHQYGDAGNSTCSHDQRLKGDMQVLWFGRPGPRPMTDRGTRAPAPLSTDGRLFVQGDRFLFGLDAYNGTMLWVRNIPDLRRANIPRDGSNMAATEDALYVAVRERCWQLDPRTGRVVRTFELPEPGKGVTYDWGYLACKGDLLFGSAVQRGGLFIGADGEWYDRPDEESQKVVSDYVFALDRKTGQVKWTYRAGKVINPTLAMGPEHVYFIESRSPEAMQLKAGRMGKEVIDDRYMVSLDAKTGRKQWEHYRYFKQSKWVFYLVYANDTLVVLDTTDKYHLYAFDAKEGDPLWNKTYNFRRNHHGGAMQHPVVVGDNVYAEPAAFELRTGKPVQIRKPANGCGTVSAAANALFYRDGVHTMYDLTTHKQTKWTGMRPSCWLTIISAGGLVLAPEGSAGCHCAWPIQTSIAFAPKSEAMGTATGK